MRYWKKINENGDTTTVEKYSHHLDVEGAIEITEDEFDAFIASLPKSEPPKDRLAELEARVAELEKK